MKAVQYDGFGDVDVLEVREIATPAPAEGEVLVRVRAAAVNPGEGAIRLGLLAEKFPSTFPSGQGSDLAGVVTQVGPGVTSIAVGEDVLGYSHARSSHAEFVAVPADQVVPKPAGLTWEEAGSIYVAGTAAWASVEAVGVRSGDLVVVSGATGGVGVFAVQLARARGADVIGVAGPANHAWLADHGAVPVAYGHGVAERIREAAAERAIDAFIDTYGHGYIDVALELGVAPGRINTVIDFAGAAEHGTGHAGNESATSPRILRDLAAAVERGDVEIPIAAVYPLAEVRAAFREVEQRHTRGKIVLRP